MIGPTWETTFVDFDAFSQNIFLLFSAFFFSAEQARTSFSRSYPGRAREPLRPTSRPPFNPSITMAAITMSAVVAVKGVSARRVTLKAKARAAPTFAVSNGSRVQMMQVSAGVERGEPSIRRWPEFPGRPASVRGRLGGWGQTLRPLNDDRRAPPRPPALHLPLTWRPAHWSPGPVPFPASVALPRLRPV